MTPWYEMHMRIHHGLSRSSATIDAHVVPISQSLRHQVITVFVCCSVTIHDMVQGVPARHEQ